MDTEGHKSGQREDHHQMKSKDDMDKEINEILLRMEELALRVQ